MAKKVIEQGIALKDQEILEWINRGATNAVSQVTKPAIALKKVKLIETLIGKKTIAEDYLESMVPSRSATTVVKPVILLESAQRSDKKEEESLATNKSVTTAVNKVISLGIARSHAK